MLVWSIKFSTFIEACNEKIRILTALARKAHHDRIQTSYKSPKKAGSLYFLFQEVTEETFYYDDFAFAAL